MRKKLLIKVNFHQCLLKIDVTNIATMNDKKKLCKLCRNTLSILLCKKIEQEIMNGKLTEAVNKKQ